MSNRSLIVLLAVLLVAAGAFAAGAFFAYRGVQNELAERERSIEERAREKEARREEERRVFAEWAQAQDRAREAEDNAIPPPREKPARPPGLIAIDPEPEGLPVIDPDGGIKSDGKAKAALFPLPSEDPEAKATRDRSLRWVLRFRVAGGKDYVEQLQAMGAEILIPLPPDNKKCVLFRDLGNPVQKDVTDADLKRLADKVQFYDKRKEPVAGVMDVLKVEGKPTEFWAFFPKVLEEELARKEANYRNRRAEDIEETVFQVAIRGGKFDIVVVDQVRKR